MKALKFYLLFLFLGGIFSCHKKEYPKPLEVLNSAIYYSKLVIDNQPVVLEAGVNGYYMYSSYVLSPDFVYSYVADLRQSDCSTCANSLKVQINDYKTSLSGSSSVIDTSLRVDYYPFLSGNPESSYSVKFESIPDHTFSYYWDFGNGNTSTDPSPVEVFSKAGKYNVCLTTKSNNSYASTLCNQEKIDISDKSCKTRIVASPTSGNSISFSNITTGKAPFQYLWNFGDGTTSTSQSYTCNYKYRGTAGVSLRVVDATGDTAYAHYNARTRTDSSSSAANYYISSIEALPHVPAFSQVTISWRDAAGVVYTSDSALQPDNSSFQILSVSENDANEKMQPTKKITARFNCKLYHGDKSITVNDAEVVICVAYN